MDAALTAPAPSVSVRRTGRGRLGALATLVGRRFSLTAHTPREIFVPASSSPDRAASGSCCSSSGLC